MNMIHRLVHVYLKRASDDMPNYIVGFKPDPYRDPHGSALI
jgi:hypothetical protein